ncbi:uncharacterized protein BCR38DRAFT_10654 [Pseudomassariella vexata]|uniref:Uncharacterized protein n=1 Tax=Pseudomassariella vexata TaxID=1141098 RepID=A0A1Y2EIN7_9PEZI|nr:uncharacterized protein BCR38DRAFT_10654 [Pseudomassariella vexata]ORY71459.1 hypothetical protein BCR38DRAFT_10654 [Pseudomassariella vexata]
MTVLRNTGFWSISAVAQVVITTTAQLSLSRCWSDRFADGNMIDWTSYDGDWSVVNERLTVSGSPEAKVTLDTNFTDLIFDASVTVRDIDDSIYDLDNGSERHGRSCAGYHSNALVNDAFKAGNPPTNYFVLGSVWFQTIQSSTLD